MGHIEFPPQLFITGTDTGIGKTVVAAVLVAGLRAEYWKPVQCGLEPVTDTLWVREKTGLPPAHFHAETYCLRFPASPHASAAREGIRISLDAFQPPYTRNGRCLIMEGAGGIMVPLNEQCLMLDLMKRMGAAVLLVASTGLGTINHTLLSLEQLRRHGLEVFGIVLNGPKDPGNRAAIEHFGGAEVIAELEPLSLINEHTLVEAFERNFGERDNDTSQGVS